MTPTPKVAPTSLTGAEKATGRFTPQTTYSSLQAA